MRKYKSILIVTNDVQKTKALFFALGLGVNGYKAKVFTLLPTMSIEEQTALKYLIDDGENNIVGIVKRDDIIKISGALRMRFHTIFDF